MKISIEVYTKDVNAALEAFKLAIESGATNVNLCSTEERHSNKFKYLNLTFDADHSSPAISHLDNGHFVQDTDDL